MNCWNCRAEVSPGAFFCPECEYIQPPKPGRSHFEILGIPASFHVDRARLEKAYKKRSRRLHPDRFAMGTPRERRFSLEHTTALNDAWRILRDPLKRSEYLLGLWGRPTAESSQAPLPPDFLETIMELRENIGEAAMDGDQTVLSSLLDRVGAMWADVFAALRSSFAELEASEGQLSAEKLDHAAGLLHRLRYLNNILAEYDRVPDLEHAP